MNILIIADVPDWAIGTLTNKIVQYNDRHNFFIVYAHPKKTDSAIEEIRGILKNNVIDLWHAQYWNSGVQLADKMPELREIKSIVTHHNHKHLEEKDWKEYFDGIVSQTTYACERLAENHEKVFLIPHGIDLDEFSYIKERKDDGKTVGYIGRVLPHKNLAKICEVASSLNYNVLGSGYIDKPNYWQEEVQKYVENGVLKFNGGIGRNQMNSWESKNACYEYMTCFVMYSTEEVETGTLPLLEAMARGVPVLATNQGMARDLIKDGENGLIFDETNFQEKLDMLMKDRDLQEKLRKNARKTMNQYSEEKMALQYGDVYNKIIFEDRPLVSVIIPTYNRSESLSKVINSVAQQTYENIELIIVDDQSDKFWDTQAVVDKAKEIWRNLPIALIQTTNTGYGLAEARNRGVIEARGEIIVFLDDRLEMDIYAVEQFVQTLQPRQWNFGCKRVNGLDSGKRDFVENFSAIYKHDIALLGGFNERLVLYGGMSQDVRTRCEYAGIEHHYIDGAIANQIVKTSSMKKPEEVWKSKLLLWKIYG